MRPESVRCLRTMPISGFSEKASSSISLAVMETNCRSPKIFLLLGVQRPTITNAARELERAGLIERGRRQLTILDRRALTKASCECYQLVRDRTAFHLPKTYT